MIHTKLIKYIFSFQCIWNINFYTGANTYLVERENLFIITKLFHKNCLNTNACDRSGTQIGKAVQNYAESHVHV